MEEEGCSFQSQRPKEIGPRGEVCPGGREQECHLTVPTSMTLGMENGMEMFPWNLSKFPPQTAAKFPQIDISQPHFGISKTGCQGDFSRFSEALFAFPGWWQGTHEGPPRHAQPGSSLPPLTEGRIINADKVNSGCIIHISIYQVFMLTT